MNIKQTKEGWYIIEQDTHVGKWVEETGKLDHDEFLIPIACENMKEGWIVMDCGALYGDHTIAYAKKVGKDGAVIAIEANPLAFQCLSKNAEKFDSEVICINTALGEHHGRLAFHELIGENIGANRVSEEKNGNSQMKQVMTATIDGIANDAQLDRLNFIKIDCEGWEFKILKGAKNVLENLKPILMIEMNEGALKEQGATYKDIYDYLLEMNYSWRIIQPDLKGGNEQYDIICWPNLIQKLKLIKPQ